MPLVAHSGDIGDSGSSSLGNDKVCRSGSDSESSSSGILGREMSSSRGSAWVFVGNVGGGDKGI
jgi:hypothetical protein